MILDIWLAHLITKDLAVADVFTPDQASADAGHHVDCREQLQEA